MAVSSMADRKPFKNTTVCIILLYQLSTLELDFPECPSPCGSRGNFAKGKIAWDAEDRDEAATVTLEVSHDQV